MPKIISRLELTYHSYLKLKCSDVIDRDDFFNKSLLSIQNNKIHDSMNHDIDKLKVKESEVMKMIKSYIDENKITTKIFDSLTEYMTIYSKQQETFGGLALTPSKQQIKLQQKLAEIVKKNKILYDMIVNHDKILSECDKLISQQHTYKTYKDTKYSLIEKFLKKMEYILEDGDDYKIGEYGIIASNINDCNPFILTEIFSGNILHKMTPRQIICLLSILTEKIISTKKDDMVLSSIKVDPIVKDAIHYLEERIEHYVVLERELGLYSESGYWDLSYDYIELTDIWASIDLEKEDHTRILTALNQMEEYEGTFIKNILKLSNIVRNLITICMTTQQLELLPVFHEIDKMLIKGMVNVDSIYVS
jgi:hypothetical protein